MGTVNRSTKSATGTTNFASSTEAKASEVNSDFNAIYSEFNGNVDNDNIKAGANIAASKVNLTTVSQNIVNTGTFTNNGNVNVVGQAEADSLKLTTATTVNTILDEDDMASDNASGLATQQSIKAYVDNSLKSFGSWASATVGSDTQASTDGWLKVVAIGGNGNKGYTVVKTDSSSSPSTVRGGCSCADQTTGNINYINGDCIPVKALDYYNIANTTLLGSPTFAAYWIPLE